jgi:phosphonate dehydrogenase
MTEDSPLILVTHRIFPETRAMLDTAGTVAAPPKNKYAIDLTELRRAAAQTTAIMAFMPDRVDDAFLAACPRLRIVAGALKGYDNFDAAAFTRHGVWLSIVPDLLTVPTAELTIGLMIGVARHLRSGDAHVRGGDFAGWRPTLYGRGLAGTTAGLIGLGAIGRAIAERLAPFGMRLLYTDPRDAVERKEEEHGLARVTLDDLLTQADYVITAAPLTSDTLHLLNDATLTRMKPGSLLINPSRGSVVDEAAVLRALQSGHLGGYAADVFEMEDWQRQDRPRIVAKALLEHPNTLFTPHLGSAVVEARLAIERRAAENILDCFESRRPRDAVAGPGI